MPSVSDLRTPAIVGCGVVALVIAGSTLLRGRVRTVHLLFAAFAADIGFWYLSQSLFFSFPTDTRVWQTAVALLAVLLPLIALSFFEAMIPHESERRPRASRVALQARDQFQNNRKNPAPPPLPRDWIYAHDATVDTVPAG